MMESIAPVWDANQTWLVFGGVPYCRFPVVYGVFSSALYIPLMTFIAGLIFRGSRSSFAPIPPQEALEPGLLLRQSDCRPIPGACPGGILTGIKVSGNHFAGGAFDWLNPFSIMVGIALIPAISCSERVT